MRWLWKNENHDANTNIRVRNKKSYLKKFLLPSSSHEIYVFDVRKNKLGVESLIGYKIYILFMEEPTATKRWSIFLC